MRGWTGPDFVGSGPGGDWTGPVFFNKQVILQTVLQYNMLYIIQVVVFKMAEFEIIYHIADNSYSQY